MSWLDKLFGNPKKALEELVVYKAEPKKRKKRRTLTEDEEKRIVIDYSINRIKRKDIAIKYDCSYTAVSRILYKSGLPL